MTLTENVLAHCEHAHTWVRLAAAQLWGLYLAAWSPQELLDADKTQDIKPKRRKKEDDQSNGKSSGECEYLVNNVEEKVWDIF